MSCERIAIKRGRKGGTTRKQIGFIEEQHATNSGAVAALKMQLVAFRGAGDSWLIGFPDACEEAPILHLYQSH
jgi:hypothetical protein